MCENLKIDPVGQLSALNDLNVSMNLLSVTFSSWKWYAPLGWSKKEIFFSRKVALSKTESVLVGVKTPS